MIAGAARSMAQRTWIVLFSFVSWKLNMLGTSDVIFRHFLAKNGEITRRLGLL
jgi:hypothetical protein